MRLGHDVEFILINQETNLPVSVVGRLGGTKEAPREVEDGAVQEDNVLAEINIIPALLPFEWEQRTHKVIEQLKQLLPSTWLLSTLASAEYAPEQLTSPAAQRFGCDPDFNAWRGGSENRTPLSRTALRTAGGHVHIEIPLDSLAEQCTFIQLLDSTVGLWTMLVDTDQRRRNLYGGAGAFRPKPYGIEWRVPSNFWVHTTELRLSMFKHIHRCREVYLAGEATNYINPNTPNIINKNNIEQAQLGVINSCLDM